MRILSLTTVALALLGAAPTRAADPTPADVSKELKALQERVRQLEQQQKELQQHEQEAAQPGMTPEQQADLNRIVVKAEALEDARDASGLKGLKISAYMDPTYVYNFAKQRGTFQFIVPAANEGYAYDDSYFGTVSLDIQKETEGGIKFHLNLIPKRATGDFNENSIVNEASVWIPLGNLSRKLFLGQVPDWSGYEYQSPVLNLLVTHNLLFDFTLPYFYTGAGLELVSPRLDLKLMVANYNTSVRKIGEHVPAFVFRGDYTPRGNDYWGFGFAGGLGQKTNLRDEAGKDSFFATGEVDGWYTRGNLTFDAQVTYGMQQKAAITASSSGALRDAWWAGASALVAYKLTPRLQGVVRADIVYDQANGGGLLDWTAADAANGVGPDPKGGNPDRGASKGALTVGLNYAFSPNVLFKVEGRIDAATERVFGNKDALTEGPDPKYSRVNELLATQAVFYF